MTNTLRSTIFGLLVGMPFLGADAHADTFEFLSYTPPPSGWTKQAATDGNVYRRANGIGLIYFYASYPATGSAADEFPKIWRARVESILPGQAPKPQVQRDGDYAVAVGARQVDAQGTITTISLVTVVGRGRAVGVLTMTAGDEALKEITAFLDSLTITPDSKSASGSSTVQTGGIEVDFDVPPGYVSQRDGNTVILKPTTLDRNTPCIYGISPARQSGGKLDTDAAAAILEPLPGWQVKSDHYNAMRGTAGAGWPYYWIRTDVRRLVGASYENLTAMAMAFPAGSGRVNIVWGFGSNGICMLDDHSFLRLFHSLRPRGWTSDGGKAFSRELQGTWRDTQNVGMAQYRFMPTGRYEYGLGTSTTFGNLETRTGSVGDGRYVLRDDELTITPDARGRGTSKLRVRIYDHYNKGGWVRAMSLLNENSNPPLDVQYMRVEDSR